MAEIIGFPVRAHARTSRRSKEGFAAIAASRSAVTPDRRAVSVRNSADQKLAGMDFLDRHLRMVEDGTPKSVAIALGDGQQAITSGKEESIVVTLDQSGPQCNTILERDKVSRGSDNGSQKEPGMGVTDENAAFIRRTREARLARFPTMEPIAALLRITVAQYKHYEKRSPMPSTLVVPFCYATGVDLEWLLQGTGKGPAASQVSPPKKERTSKPRKGRAA